MTHMYGDDTGKRTKNIAAVQKHGRDALSGPSRVTDVRRARRVYVIYFLSLVKMNCELISL